MFTQRLLGISGLVAVVVVGVVGVDRLSKQTRDNAGAPNQTTVVTAQNTQGGVTPSRPARAETSVHFQVDPQTPAPPPPAPTTATAEPPVVFAPGAPPAPTPLASTGELEKQLKESLQKLDAALPKPLFVPAAEESSLPDLPQVPTRKDDAKDLTPAAPPLPAINHADGKEPLAKPETPPLPGVVPPPAPDNLNPDERDRPIGNNLPPPPPPGLPSSARDADPLRPTTNPTAPTPALAREDFQKRLTELEIGYLKQTVEEMKRRLGELPASHPDRRKVEMDHQRFSERLGRLAKLMERRSDLLTTSGDKAPESPWTMTMETVDGKTVIDAIVHRKARFKVTCERLDLQAPRGTLLAVGHVQLAGEGFHGSCDRLSIPLHEDRLILEGNAEVGIRAQMQALVETRSENGRGIVGQGIVPGVTPAGALTPDLETPRRVPPAVEGRRAAEESGPMPMLHLRGEHLDLRWHVLHQGQGSTRLVPEAAPSSSSPSSVAAKAGSGPTVKVGFSPERDEQWSEWGTLRRTGGRDGLAAFVLEDRQGKIMATIQAPAGMSLAEYVGRRVSVFGRMSREEGRPQPVFQASHVAWE